MRISTRRARTIRAGILAARTHPFRMVLFTEHQHRHLDKEHRQSTLFWDAFIYTYSRTDNPKAPRVTD